MGCRRGGMTRSCRRGGIFGDVVGGRCIYLFERGFCGCCVEVELIIVGVGLVGLGRIGSIRSEQE